MKGFPVHVECYGTLVRVWVENPVGYSDADNHELTITCLDADEARQIGIRWASVWNVNCYDGKEGKILAEMWSCECEVCEGDDE